MQMHLKVFPAANGDCLLLKLTNNKFNKNILIDGGKGVLCHRKLKRELESIKNNKQYIDLLVLTHIDDDHISGILKVYKDKKIDKTNIKNVWFNSGSLISDTLNGRSDKSRELEIEPTSRKMSVRQGKTLESLLKGNRTWSQYLITSGMKFTFDEVKVIVLSPDLDTLKDLNDKWDKELAKLKEKDRKKREMSYENDYTVPISELIDRPFIEDKSIFNRSSIAFMLEYGNKKILLLGDSHPSVISSSLRDLGYSERNKLKLNMIKVSHHGSKKNTNFEFLELIDCKDFIISSDGRNHGLPNKESLSKIICTMKRPITFHFNYLSMEKIFTKEECEEYDLSIRFLTEKNDYTLEVV